MILVEELDDVRKYDLDGEDIYIVLDDSSIVVENAEREKVGGFIFRCIEEENGTFYKITNMYMTDKSDSYKGRGIGTECLTFFKNYHDACIIAGKNNDTQSDDGSHLTGNAPAFINKVRKLGIIG